MKFGAILVLRGIIPVFVGIVSGAVVGSVFLGTGHHYANSTTWGNRDYWTMWAMLFGAVLGGTVGGILGLTIAVTGCSKSTAATIGGIAGIITAIFCFWVWLKYQTDKMKAGHPIQIDTLQIILLLACIPIGALVAVISSWSNKFR